MKNYFLFLYLVLLVSCDANQKSRVALSEINLNNIEEGTELISIRRLMKNVEFLRLKSKDEYYLSEATKIKLVDNKFFIYDKNKASLTCWSEKGEFLGLVGNKGLGPEEYRGVSDFDIHPERNSVFIFSRTDKAIIEYDSNLNFIKRFRVEPWALYLSVLTNGDIALYSYFDYPEKNIIIYDAESGQEIDQRMSYPNTLNRKLMNYTGFLRGDYYTYPLSNKVFKVGNSEEFSDSLYFEIKFPDQRNPELKYEHEEYLNNTNRENNEILRDFTVGDKGSEILFYYGYRTRGRTGMTIGVMNKTGQVFGHLNLKHGGRDKSGPFNKLFFLNPYNVPRYSRTDGFFYLACNQAGMSNVFGDDREEFLQAINELDVDLFNELKQMKEGDNPIIMKFQLKDRYRKMKRFL